MAAITGRFTALEDVSVFTISGASVTTLFKTGNLEITADEIDVTALMDSWKKREFGTFDWKVTVSKLIQTSPKFLSYIVSGGTIVVSFACTGFSFLGTGMITGVPMSVENPMTEELTIISAGNAPDISFT